MSNRVKFEQWAKDHVAQFNPAGHCGRDGVWVYQHNNLQHYWTMWQHMVATTFQYATTPDGVKARLRGQTNDELLSEFESSARSIATSEAMSMGRPMAEHDHIPYEVFRRELPLVRAEILNRMKWGPRV